MNKTLKIALIIIGVVIVLVLAFAVGGNGSSSSTTSPNQQTNLSTNPEEIIANAQSESESIKDNEKKEFTQISLTQYLEYYAGSEPKIILLARPTCHYCQIAEPIIQNVAYEYNIDINYLNTDDFTEDDQKNFIYSNDEFKEGYGTPLLFIVKDNQIIDKVDGLTDKAHYKEFFRLHGYIQ